MLPADREARFDGRERRNDSRVPQVVVFDAMGTLFDLEPVRAKLLEIGARAPTLEAWFERILHTALALTAVGEFEKFQEIAEATLQTVFAQLELDDSRADEVLETLREVSPYDDAAAALERVRSAGARAVVLTNGGGDQTKTILKRAGIVHQFDHIFSVEEIRTYKPDPRTYRYVLEQLEIDAAKATMVAAHAWDAVGARAVGLGAIWITRLERRWPLPVRETDSADTLVEAAEKAAAP